MFVSQAHSFAQQARLAVTLAWVSGYTNIVTFLACGHATSHVSGTTSQLGQGLFERNFDLAFFSLFLLAAFFVGAAISGFCTELGRRRGWESIYVLPIVIEMVILAAFAVLLNFFTPMASPGSPLVLWLMTGLASAAMGLQNATITRISNGTVRTTHVTGVLTDLGHDTVGFLWWLRDRKRNVPPAPVPAVVHSVFAHPTARRVALLGSIILSFTLGAGLATLAHAHLPKAAMIAPVAFLLWIIYQDIKKPIAEIEASSLITARLDLPSSLAVFHLRKDHDRKGRVHRMPNLLAWFERLPETKKIVVLDLAEATDLDENATLELQAVLTRFARDHRHLIVSGINQNVLSRVRSSISEETLPNENLCPDLELAVARGLNLLET
jgi:uncharacterized membrane protein YoaK (UPF0700 family)